LRHLIDSQKVKHEKSANKNDAALFVEKISIQNSENHG